MSRSIGDYSKYQKTKGYKFVATRWKDGKIILQSNDVKDISGNDIRTRKLRAKKSHPKGDE